MTVDILPVNVATETKPATADQAPSGPETVKIDSAVAIKPISLLAEPTSETKETKEVPTIAPGRITETNLKLPDGDLLRAQDLERIAADATARGLTPEQAQAEVDREAAIINRFAERHDRERIADMHRLAEMSKADPEIGGQKMPETQELARSVLRRFDPQRKISAVLEETGLANDPEVLRFLRGVGVAMRPDKLTGRASPQPLDRSIGETLFGKVGQAT